MDDILSSLTIIDWILLGLVASATFIVAIDVYAIRKEMRAAARQRARPVKLKTTEEQRRKWRSKRQSRDLVDLVDDVDTLLRHVEEE
jgi:hypothetical protein